jgi:predicted HicB family RNase H-like nuclease
MKPTASQIKASAKRYLKIVEWDDEDHCYVGSAPPLIGQSCHGKTEADVLAQLQTIVEEWVATLLADGKPLPGGTANRKFSGKFIVRISPEIHRKVALKAMARGDSLNEFVSDTLAAV